VERRSLATRVLVELATPPGEPRAEKAADTVLTWLTSRALASGEPIHREWLTFHWPPYWHYDVLQALVVLGRLGVAADPRAADAVELVRSRRRSDGRWRASARWWNPPGSTRAAEAADWRGGDAADRLVTLRALTVLRGVGLAAAETT